MRPDAQTTGARNTGAQATSAQQDGALEVAVLVSVGRHPVTGRARRADQDARGVELTLSLAGARISLLHAGALDEESEAVLEGEALDVGHGLLFVEGIGHAGEAEFAELGEGLFKNHRSSSQF